MGTEDWYINTREYYSAVKRKSNAILATYMDLEIIILREGDQTQKDKY